MPHIGFDFGARAAVDVLNETPLASIQPETRRWRMRLSLRQRIQGSILTGAYGDALGSAYESMPRGTQWSIDRPRLSAISDDTQLTLATCTSITTRRSVDPGHIAVEYLRWHAQSRLTGLGASTLKALRDLQLGSPWYLAGNVGERAAGNGAAIRIAPLAFWLAATDDMAPTSIRDVCSITHKNDEAFVGALAVVEALWAIDAGCAADELLPRVAGRLPDTAVRDRVVTFSKVSAVDIAAVASTYGSSGYVVESVPLALFAAAKAPSLGIGPVLDQLVRAGGDADSNASICGQIAGAMLGLDERIGAQLVPLADHRDLVAFTEEFATACEQHHSRTTPA